MSMLRTMRNEGSDREVAFIHYARSAQEACYADELAAMSGVRVLHGYTRDGRAISPAISTRITWPPQCLSRMRVFVCGPQALVDAVRTHYPKALSESFVPPVFTVQPKHPAGESYSPIAALNRGRRPTDCSSKPSPRASLRKADAEWVSATAAPAARPAVW